MNFGLSEEQAMIRQTFARFVDEKVRPRAAEIDENKAVPQDLFSALAKMGFFGLRYPEEVGGTNLDMLSYCLAIEELARGSLSLAAAAAMQSLMGTRFLHTLGDSSIRERLLIPALKGEKIGAICITEPNAGSDLSSIATSAVRSGDEYIIDGQKMWITSAPSADFFTVFARTGEAASLTIFLVERGTKGLDIGRAIEKMGTWGTPTSEVVFENCRVPLTNRLGEEGEGEKQLRTILAEIRVMTGALALGVGRAALADSLRYARERIQFGRPIAKFQAIQHKFADMATDLDAATLLVHHAAWLIDQGLPHQREAAAAKLFASERGCAVCDQATRILGSYGFAMEYPVQRYFRDIRFTLYGGGTSEILKSIIARELDL